MSLSIMWSDVRPWMPWLVTSVSMAYVLYIHCKLRRLKDQKPRQEINPFIDKHKPKVKHVFKGQDLDTDDNQEFECHSDVKTSDKTSTDGVEANDKRPRGRRSAYSYFVSECAEKESNRLCQSSEDRMIFADFAKRCAHSWKKLSEEEKQYFHGLSEEDKERYDNEMKRYRKLRSKSKSKPKKICTKEITEDISEDNLLNMAFDLFAGEEMPVVRDQRPSITDNNEEILTELLGRWEKSEPEFKNHYLDRIRLESTAFNMSFNTSIREDDDLSVDGLAVDNNCGSDQELEPEVKSYRCVGAGDQRRSPCATAHTMPTMRSTTTTSDPLISNGTTTRRNTTNRKH